MDKDTLREIFESPFNEKAWNTVYYSIADESIFELCNVVCHTLKTRSAELTAVFG